MHFPPTLPHFLPAPPCPTPAHLCCIGAAYSCAAHPLPRHALLRLHCYRVGSLRLAPRLWNHLCPTMAGTAPLEP